MNLQLEDVCLFYERSGQGPSMILLHGNGEDHHIFDPLAKRLEADYSVYALDSRGHGRSTRDHGRSTHDSALTYQAMVKDLSAFIDRMYLQEVRLLGFSDGAIVALLFALNNPNRLHSMALLGVNLHPHDFLPEIHESLNTDIACHVTPCWS